MLKEIDSMAWYQTKASLVKFQLLCNFYSVFISTPNLTMAFSDIKHIGF